MAEAKQNTQPLQTSEVPPAAVPETPQAAPTAPEIDMAEYQAFLEFKKQKEAKEKQETPAALTLEQVYGPGYVRLYKDIKDNTTGIVQRYHNVMTQTAYNNWTTVDKDGTKDGWRKDIPTPPEVLDIQKGK